MATYALVNPLVAVVLGWAVAGEPVTTRGPAAATAVVTAVALILSARAGRAERPTTAERSSARQTH